MSVGNARIVRISRGSSYPRFEGSGMNCMENSTQTKGNGNLVKFGGVSVIRGSSYRG